MDERFTAGETASGGNAAGGAGHVTAAVYEIMVTTKAMQEYGCKWWLLRIVLPNQNITSAQKALKYLISAHNDLWADGYYLSLPLTARLVLPDVQPYVA